MAESKNIQANILIQAKVAGLNAVKGLSDSLKKSANQAKAVSVSFMKFAKAGAALALGFEGVKSAYKFMEEGVHLAEAAEKAHQNLNAAIAHRGDLVKEAERKGIPLESQGKALAKLADEMERTGVVSATALETGFAGLIKAGFSPETINKSAKGFEGLVVGLKGIGASSKDVGDVSNQIKSIVKLGTKARLPAEWKKILTQKDIAALKAANSEGKRRAWIRDIEARNEYRIAQAMEKTEGKLWRADQAWKRIQKRVGEPFAKSRLAFAQASETLAVALEPIANQISDVLTPALEGLAQWFTDHKKDIEEFGLVLLGVFDLSKWEPAIKGVFDYISKEFFGPLKTGLAPIFQPIVDAANKIWGEIQGPLGDMVNSIKAYFKGEVTWDEMWVGLKDSWSKVSESFAKFDYGKLATDIGQGLLQALQTAASNAATFTVDLVTKIGDSLSKVDWNSVARLVGEGLGKALAALTIGVWNFSQWIVQMQMNMGDAIAGADWGKVITQISEGIDKAVQSVVDFGLNLATSLIEGIVKGITGTDLGGITDAFLAGLQKTLAAIIAEVSTWGPKIIAAIGDIALNILMPKLPGIDTSFQRVKGGSVTPGGTPGPGMQLGGLVSSPGMFRLAEKGIPEMVIPMQQSTRSMGLLSEAAKGLGMGGRGTMVGGPTSVSVSPVINISGATGETGAMQREIERAMENPVRTLLEQLKKARDEEHRLAYV